MTHALTSYDVRHLVAHLKSAGRIADIHKLLAVETPHGRNMWYEAAEQFGETSGYLTDIDTAWRAADSSHPPTVGNAALQARYALVTSSVRSIADSIPPPLLGLLVAQQVFSLTKGIAYAMSSPDPTRRAHAVLSLCLHAQAPALVPALTSVVRSLGMIPNWLERVRLLAALAPYLPEPLLEEVIAITARREWESSEAMFEQVIPHLPDHMLQLVLRTQRERPWSDHDWTNDKLLAAMLVRQCALGQARTALDAIDEIHDSSQRALALGNMARHLPLTMLQEAMAMVDAIPESKAKAYTRRDKGIAFARFARGSLASPAGIQRASFIDTALGKALVCIPLDSTDFQHIKSEVAAVVAAHDSAVARTIRSRTPRSEAARPRRHALLTILRGRPVTTLREQTDLVSSAGRLPAPLRRKAVRLALSSAWRKPLDTDQAGRVSSIDQAGWKAFTEAIVGQLNAKELREVLENTAVIGDERDIASASEAFARDHDSGERVERNAHVNANVNANVNASSTASDAAKVFDTLFDASGRRLGGDPGAAAFELARIAPMMSGALLHRALEAAEALPDWKSTPDNRLMSEAMHAANSPPEERDTRPRSIALTGVVVSLARQGEGELALGKIEAIGDDFWRGRALAGIAPYLPRPLLPAAIDAARRLPFNLWQESRPEAIAQLAVAAVRCGEWPDANALIRQVDRADVRGRMIKAVVSIVTDSQSVDPHVVWSDLLRALSLQNRRELLHDIACLPRLARALGGETAAAVRKEIAAVGRWWR